ncbi:MAG: hypothetical protein H2057_05070 [Alphaproteobacteria bacterium]|nr:hypothetical protein [Alphaproteobacteria bacterium]
MMIQGAGIWQIITHRNKDFTNLYYARKRKEVLFNAPNGFDVHAYLARHQDVADAARQAGQNQLAYAADHYCAHGYFEGRQYALPQGFNPEIYLKLHPDVAAAAYVSTNAHDFAIQHYFNAFAEKRAYQVVLPKEFDADAYFYLNPDVHQQAAQGRNVTATFAHTHYTQHGYFENRGYKCANKPLLYMTPQDFNATVYLAHYSDVADLARQLGQNSHDVAAAHFREHGYREGRHYTLPTDFDPAVYRRMHKDVDQAVQGSPTWDQFITHHYFAAYQEKRPYKAILPDHFDDEAYFALNPDIAELARSQKQETSAFAQKHYLSFGFCENRAYRFDLPADFKASDYADLHADLDAHLEALLGKNVSHDKKELALKAHYHLWGRREGRAYKSTLPEGFDHKAYFPLNDDIKKAAKAAGQENETYARKHYLRRGEKEGRAYRFDVPEDFNMEEYQELYEDVEELLKRCAYTEKELEAKKHYHLIGRAEGRRHKNFLPTDFNYEEYYVLNPEVKALARKKWEYTEETFAKKHYLRWGAANNLAYRFDVPENFTMDDYLFLNPDLEAIARQSLITKQKEFLLKEHYHFHGKAERRACSLDDLPRDFDADVYLNIHQDVYTAAKDASDFTHKYAIRHYLRYGKHEERIYALNLPYSFKEADYLALNPELNSFLGLQGQSPECISFRLRFHYGMLGWQSDLPYKIEIPDDFDYRAYLLLNPDVAEGAQRDNRSSDLFAEYHYLKHGIFERRPYAFEVPEDFDPDLYLAYNPDLHSYLNDNPSFDRDFLLEKHYHFYGRNENRTIL